MWISNAENAGVFLVMANVDPSAVRNTLFFSKLFISDLIDLYEQILIANVIMSLSSPTV